MEVDDDDERIDEASELVDRMGSVVSCSGCQKGGVVDVCYFCVCSFLLVAREWRMECSRVGMQ